MINVRKRSIERIDIVERVLIYSPSSFVHTYEEIKRSSVNRNVSIQKNALLPFSLFLRRRGFRRRAYAAFSQTLLNLRPIVMHNEKEDGSRSLGRSSDTVYYDGSVPTQRSGEEKEREREGRGKRADSCIYTWRDSRLWRDQNRPLFVTSGYLAGHFRTRVGTYSLPTAAYQIFRCSCSKLPSNIIASCSTSRCRSLGYVFEPSKSCKAIFFFLRDSNRPFLFRIPPLFYFFLFFFRFRNIEFDQTNCVRIERCERSKRDRYNLSKYFEKTGRGKKRKKNNLEEKLKELLE